MTTSVLRITDGTTTKTFTSGDNMKLITYEPRTSTDGSDISENARVDFTSTASTNRTNITAINRLFAQARNYAKTNTGAKVYVEFDPGTSGTAWRSLLRDGRIVYTDQILGPWQYDTRFLCTIEWTRQPFWEGGLTQIPLTNNYGTDNTSGLEIYNGYDPIYQIEKATVVGTVTLAGDATIVFTAEGTTGSPISKEVALLLNDTATQVAAKFVTALNADTNISSRFNIVSGAQYIFITRKVHEANDTTLNLSYVNNTCAGLTNDTSSDVVRGGTASSATDYDNYVSINDEDVAGDLPAPVKIEILHSINSGTSEKEIFIFHNVYSSPFTLDPIIEAEDGATADVLTVTAGSASEESGVLYANMTWTATTETNIGMFTLNTTDLSKCAGGRFAIIARWKEAFPYTDMYLRLRLISAINLDTIWDGNLQLVNSTSGLTWLDTVRLPPFLIGQASLKGVFLRMRGLRNQSGAHSLDLDYLMLCPISGEGGWKRFVSIDDGITYNEYFTHDGIEGITYRTDTSSKIVSEFSEYGGPILLEPNRDQRLYFLTRSVDDLNRKGNYYSVKVWYRPRRSSL